MPPNMSVAYVEYVEATTARSAFKHLAYKRYLMQGLDDVTLSAAYPQANVFTMGIGFQW